MKKIVTLAKKNKQFLLYSIIGSIAAGTDISIFTILVKVLSFNVLLSNAISNTIGTSISFILNRQFNFKVKDNALKRFIIFSIVGIIGLGISTICLYILVDRLGIEEIFSKLITLIFVVIVQYTLNSKISFKNTTKIINEK